MNPPNQPHTAQQGGIDRFFGPGKLGIRALGPKLGVLAITVAGLFSLAGFASTYLSFDPTSAEPSSMLLRAAAVNAVVAAVLALVVVYLAGMAFSRSISTSLSEFNRAMREASDGNMDFRVAAVQPFFEELAENFNSMMERTSDTARSEAAQRKSLLLVIKALECSGDAIAVTDSNRSSAFYNK